MHVDDKPVVLVSDTPVEDKPLIDEGENIAACISVCVDTGVQIDDVCADHVTVHVVPRGDRRNFVSTPVRRCVGAAVRMHKGRDGRVRQLCGPGITILQGRAKKTHVQQRAPNRIEKKKVVAPKFNFMWRRKEAPSDLKTVKKHGANVDILPPFRADSHALRTTLLEGGKDDMATKEEVQPNFRTPPSC